MDRTRRAIVAGVGAAALGGLAGCSSASGDSGDGGGGGSSGDGSRLAYVRVVNRHDEAHTVHVLVTRAGEPIHWSSHDLAVADSGNGESATTVEGQWTDEAGVFSVFVRLDGADDWAEFEVGDGSVDCYGVENRIREDGRIEALYAKNPDGCATDGTATTADDGSA